MKRILMIAMLAAALLSQACGSSISICGKDEVINPDRGGCKTR